MSQSKRQAFFAGWLTQFILNLIGFHWIAYTAIEFGHFPAIGGVLSLIGFACIAHLYYPVSGVFGFYLVRRFKLHGKPALLAYALTFAICDRLFTKIFPWHLGYPWLWAKWPGTQFSDVIGFEGLNVATILVNAVVACSISEGLLRYSKAKRKAWLIVSGAAVVILAINLAGMGRSKKWSSPDAEFKVTAIQGNIGNFEKYMAELRSDFGVPIVQKYIELSRKALLQFPDSQALIWPETAFPSSLDSEFSMRPLQAQVGELTRSAKIPLLTGGYSQKFGSRDTFNGFFVIDANGQQIQTPYRKSILLVFGETFPFSEYIPYMEKLFPEQGSFTRGGGPTVMSAALNGTHSGPTLLVGPQICYEGLYPWFSAELAAKGAHIFTNVTNDSWFWKPFEPNQHLYMTLARAIEFRRPLLRATNTGITTAILATGEILEKSPMGVEWVGQYKIPYHLNPTHTTYEKYGWIWPWFLLFSLGLTLVFGMKIRVIFHRGLKK